MKISADIFTVSVLIPAWQMLNLLKGCAGFYLSAMIY